MTPVVGNGFHVRALTEAANHLLSASSRFPCKAIALSLQAAQELPPHYYYGPRNTFLVLGGFSGGMFGFILAGGMKESSETETAPDSDDLDIKLALLGMIIGVVAGSIIGTILDSVAYNYSITPP